MKVRVILVASVTASDTVAGAKLVVLVVVVDSKALVATGIMRVIDPGKMKTTTKKCKCPIAVSWKIQDHEEHSNFRYKNTFLYFHFIIFI